MKSGFVNIVGRPNVGKSSLLNRWLGTKLAIVSAKPQTTRVPMKCIYTDEKMQVIFLDTPGVQEPRNKLGIKMLEQVERNLPEGDVNVYVMDDAPQTGRLDQMVLDLAKSDNRPKLLAVNKSDLLDASLRAGLRDKYMAMGYFEDVFFVSAWTGEGLDILREALYALLPEGPMYYDEDEMTDLSTRTVCEEIMREACLHLLDQEIPHGVYIETESFVEALDRVEIAFIVYLERENHKGMFIGKDGRMIREIIRYAQRELRQFLQVDVRVKLHLKIRKNWRRDETWVKRWF